MRRAILLAALLSAGCARPPGPVPTAGAPEDPRAAACRAEARNSPAVRDAMRQMNIGNARQEELVRRLRAEAEGRALDECLRREGLGRGGGVERVVPPGFFNF